MFCRLSSCAIGGHSLFEVLAALALASAGVVGALHAQHLREATETELLTRARAAMLARDLVHKVSANAAAHAAYRTALGTPPMLAADCRHTDCSRSELATFHLAHWKCQLGRWAHRSMCRNVLKVGPLLPDGDGAVAVAGDAAQITVRWLDARRTAQSLVVDHVLLRR